MRILSLMILGWGVSAAALLAVEPATVEVGDGDFLTGQRVPLFVELRAPGPFEGTAQFSIPTVSKGVLLKIGSPVVSTEEVDDDSWFIQRHEFAFFSQQSETVTIPKFEVRFASKDGFTGPSKDRTATVGPTNITLARPPGTEQIPFLVTTEKITIKESWDPSPGTANVGDVFKRTITLAADDIPGMALPPFPATDVEGLRRYVAEPQIADELERGEFRGRRADTITYVVDSPGQIVLPAVSYQWWNPKAAELETEVLSAATFVVAAPPVASVEEPASSSHWWQWTAAIGAVAFVGGWRLRDRVSRAVAQLLARLRHPERLATRQLLRACKASNAPAASQAWNNWIRLAQEADVTLPDDLQAAVTEMQRVTYGPERENVWNGASMASAFRAYRNDLSSVQSATSDYSLPPLNSFTSSS